MVPVAVAIQPEDVRSRVWTQALNELEEKVAGEVAAQSQQVRRLPIGPLDFVEVG